jgi:hypothetical protein
VDGVEDSGQRLDAMEVVKIVKWVNPCHHAQLAVANLQRKLRLNSIFQQKVQVMMFGMM